MTARPADLDWDDLRYFSKAAKTGSLSGAARAMGVEHTTIGRRLSSLERSLGAPLVLRGPDGLQLTPLGEQVALQIAEVERAITAIQEFATSRKTCVRLATPSGFARIVSEGLSRFREEHSQIALEIVSGARIVELDRGEASLALRLGPVVDEDLIALKVGPIGFSLYASDAYLRQHPAPPDPDNLAGQELIGYDAMLAETPAGQWIEAHSTGATIVLRSREMMDVFSATLGGIGLALLPCVWADDEPSLRRLTSRVLASYPASLVYPREARLSEPVQVVARFVADLLRRQARRISGVCDET